MIIVTSPTPSTTTTNDNTQAVTDLLSAMFQAQQQQQQQQLGPRPTIVPLNSVITSESFEEMLADPNVVNELLQFLPEGQQTEEELRQTISCPQMQQSLRSLTGALLSDNYNAVLANFGLNPADGSEALLQGDPVRAFLLALQAQADRSKDD
jgi:26S proteasome regulatory subunit N13